MSPKDGAWALREAFDAILRGSTSTSDDSDDGDRKARVVLSEADRDVLAAARKGDETALIAALDAGANANAHDQDKESALQTASRHGHAALVRVLLSRGAEVDAPNENGTTALAWAAIHGHEACLEVLLDNGAGIEVTNALGRAPLAWAAAEGHLECMRMLLARGASAGAQAKSSADLRAARCCPTTTWFAMTPTTSSNTGLLSRGTWAATSQAQRTTGTAWMLERRRRLRHLRRAAHARPDAN